MLSTLCKIFIRGANISSTIENTIEFEIIKCAL